MESVMVMVVGQPTELAVFDLDVRLERACELIVDAGQAGAQWIIFPEAYLPGAPFSIQPKCGNHPYRTLRSVTPAEGRKDRSSWFCTMETKSFCAFQLLILCSRSYDRRADPDLD